MRQHIRETSEAIESDTKEAKDSDPSLQGKQEDVPKSSSFSGMRKNVVLMQPLQEVFSKLYKPRVANTYKATRTAIRAWSSVELKDLGSKESPVRKREYEWLSAMLTERVIPDAKCSTSIHNLNFSLSEFCEHYRTSKVERVTPRTLKDYLDSINRWLREEMRLYVNILIDE